MNPVQPNGQQPMQFTDSHHAVYNALRDTLQRHIAAGVPGIEKVVDALNKQHTANMVNYTPPAPRPQATTQVQPQNSVMGRSQIQNLNDMMTQIRQRNTPAMPNGYNSYSA